MMGQVITKVKYVILLLSICYLKANSQSNNNYLNNKKEISNMGDVFNSEKFLLGKEIFSGNITYNLNRVPYKNKYKLLSSIGYGLKVKLFEEVSLSASLFVQLNKSAIQPWTPDYIYSLKRFNWRPNTFSYGYENYVNNNYSNSGKEFVENFMQGSFFGSYNHRLPKKWLKKIKLDKTTNFTITYFSKFSFKYRDENQKLHHDGRLWMGVGLRYVIFKNIYAEFAYNHFLNKKKRLPWDPDYTYGFGYFDWRPFKLSITYGNWVVNRFGKKLKQYEDYGFLDGTVQLSFNYVW